MNRLFFIYLIFIVLCSVCCKKDKGDDSEPIVTSFTISGNTFVTTDTIDYDISVEDDKEVKRVSVYIADAAWNPVTSPKVTEINASSESISGTYTFSDRYLENSSYFFICAVTDESHLVRSAIAIIIQPLQKQTEELFVLADVNSTWKIGTLNSTFDSVSFKLTLPGKPIDVVSNSYSDQIAVLYENGTVASYSYPDYSEEWNYQGLHQPGETFKGSVNVIDNLIACGTGYGRIYFFDATGTVRKTVTTSSEASVNCREFILNGDKIISYNIGYGTGHTHLDVSSYTGGGHISEYPAPEDVVRITLYESPYILVWTVNDVKTFNYENPFLYQISTYPLSPLFEVLHFSNENYLLCFGQEVYSYNPVNNVFTQQGMSGGNAMFHENASNITMCIKDKTIYFYNSVTLIKQTAFAFTPVKVFALYNK